MRSRSISESKNDCQQPQGVQLILKTLCQKPIPVKADNPVHSEFLKRDDQTLAGRLQQEERLNARKKAAVDVDRARAYGAQDGATYADQDADLDEDVQMDDVSGDNFGSKTIVFHIGSQNLRLGLATDALPKTVPMVIARKSARSEAEHGEPRPKRRKTEEDAPEDLFGEEVSWPPFIRNLNC